LKGFIMALPNGAGGYQVGDGNLSEVQLGVQGAPVALTATSNTLTAAQLTGGIITSTNASAVAITLPIVVTAGGVTGVNDVVSSAKTNSSFGVTIINLGSSSGEVTVGAGTGWSIVGTATVAINTSARFLARKTSDTTYTLYRV
jgi:hypothetical protein